MRSPSINFGSKYQKNPQHAMDQSDSQCKNHLAPPPRNLNIPPRETSKELLTVLRSHWTALYRQTLPRLARSSHPSQTHWPVYLDHCFARIILDAVVGNPNPNISHPTPWTERIPSPAVQNMTAQQLEACISLGEAIATGSVDLATLDEQSLAVRGKTKGQGQKRKMLALQTPSSSSTSRPSKKYKSRTSKESDQPTILSALGIPSANPSYPLPASISHSLASKINLSPTLTPFRRLVLLALCQVPPGQVTTYLSLSNHLHSSPRAVGNALRNNPFAPAVPCHRVVASDMSIGGFGGEWGVSGKFFSKKVELLRGEGVIVREGGTVLARVWEGFV